MCSKRVSLSFVSLVVGYILHLFMSFKFAWCFKLRLPVLIEDNYYSHDKDDPPANVDHLSNPSNLIAT